MYNHHRKDDDFMLADLLGFKYMTAKELLPFARKIYVEKFKIIAIICIFIFLPISILTSLISGYITEISSTINLEAVLSSADLLNQFIASKEYMQINKYTVLLMAVEALLQPIGQVAIIRYTRNNVYFVSEPIIDVIMYALTRGFVIVAVTICCGCLISVGSILIIPGIMLAVFFGFNLYAIGVSDLGFMGSIKQSVRLVNKRWFKTFWFFLVVAFFNIVLSNGIKTIFMFMGNSFFVNTVEGVVLSIVNAFFVILTALLYINRSIMIDKEVNGVLV